MTRLLFMGCLSYLLTGCTHVIMGAVLPELLHHYGRSYSAGGTLVFLEFGGFLLGVLAMPWSVRYLSRRTMITIAFSLLFIAMTMIALLPPWTLMILFTFVAGVAFGLVESGISTSVLLATKEQQAIAYGKLEVAFGLGALCMPLISSLLIAGGVWRLAFLLLALSALLTGGVWARLSLGEHNALLGNKADRSQAGQRSSALNRKSLVFLVLFMIVFFLYVGMENAIVNFLPSIFKDGLGASSSVATLAVTVFWVAMVGGRLFAGRLAENMTYYRYLVVSFAGAVITALAWIFSGGLWSSFALVLILGLFMAGMYAVALIYANQLLPGRTEQTTSALIAAGGCGGSVLPLGIGWGMDHFSLNVAIWFVAAGMCAVFAIMLYSRRSQGAHRGSYDRLS